MLRPQASGIGMSSSSWWQTHSLPEVRVEVSGRSWRWRWRGHTTAPRGFEGDVIDVLKGRAGAICKNSSGSSRSIRRGFPRAQGVFHLPKRGGLICVRISPPRSICLERSWDENDRWGLHVGVRSFGVPGHEVAEVWRTVNTSLWGFDSPLACGSAFQLLGRAGASQDNIGSGRFEGCRKTALKLGFCSTVPGALAYFRGAT